MKKNTLYRQCRLAKKKDDGAYVLTTWVPINLAKKGKTVSVDGEEGWSVIYVYSNITKTQKEVKAMGEYYKKHREFTDI